MVRSGTSAVQRDDTRRMEDEARRMEAKLEVLRRTLDPPTNDGLGTSSPSGYPAESSRWRGGAASKPLQRGYVKSVMEAPRPPGKQKAQPRKPALSSALSSGQGGGVGAETIRPEEVAQSVGDAPAASPFAGPQLAMVVAGGQGKAGSQSQAAANLQAATQKQSDELVEVEAFLSELKLDRYVGLFLEHGFDCMEVVREMQESHMREIGMATGHVLKLKKKLQELSPEQQPADAAGGGAAAGDTQKRVTFGGAREAEENQPKEATKKSNLKKGVEASTKLSDGNFDEDESAASFQEALRAWREGKEVSEVSKPSAAPAAPAKGPGSFWSTVGGGEMDLVRASTPLKSPSEAAGVSTETETTQRGPAAPSDEKLCCYRCYKQFFAKFAVERQSPLPGAGRPVRLCSEACADAWEASARMQAEAVRKRQEQLEKMEAMSRALQEERGPSAAPPPAVDGGGAPAASATAGAGGAPDVSPPEQAAPVVA